jgi:predicted ATPase with chaperone activity
LSIRELRAIADLDGSERIQARHVAEALQLKRALV